MVKNIIFDMDGVLVDSENAIRKACIKMFEERGIFATEDDFLPFTGMGENRFIGGVAERYGLAFNTAMKDEAYAIYDKIANDYVIAFEGVKELILKLKEHNCKVAVASAADEVKVKINLRCLGLSAADFDGLITGNDVTKHKPDPAVFLAAAEKIHAEPEECLVVEDAVAGCQAAKIAGMLCIGITSTFDEDILKKAGADFVVAKTADIFPLLEKL